MRVFYDHRKTPENREGDESTIQEHVKSICETRTKIWPSSMLYREAYTFII